MPPTSPADRLAAAIDAAGSPACIGLDPVLDRIPHAARGSNEPETLLSFCLGVLDACRGIAPAVKPQSACFERYGHAGVACLEQVISRARELGYTVVLDAKRGDIGATSAHYAAAAANAGADWITVNAYLGVSGIEPFLEAGLGVYALVRTSNPDSDAVQSATLHGGATVAEHVAEIVAQLGRAHTGTSGLSSVGAVVGATKACQAGARLRAIMPDQPLLVPGVGAQGGTAAEVRPLRRPGARSAGGQGILVNASRSVLYPEPGPGEGWQDAIARSARVLVEDLRGALAPSA